MWKRVYYPPYGFLNYEVNEFGLVRNINTKRECRYMSDGNKGYISVPLVINTTTGKYKLFKVHRLVAIAFKPIRLKNQTEVNHIDGNKQNNHIDNLSWVTPSENITHAYNIGLHERRYHKYSEDTIRKICEELSMGKRSLNQIALINKVNLNIVFCIYKRTIWKHISKDYEFKDYSRNLFDLYYSKVDQLLLDGVSTLTIVKSFNTTDLPYHQFQNLVFNRKRELQNKGLI